jgi:hypothetical protein
MTSRVLSAFTMSGARARIALSRSAVCSLLMSRHTHTARFGGASTGGLALTPCSAGAPIPLLAAEPGVRKRCARISFTPALPEGGGKAT